MNRHISTEQLSAYLDSELGFVEMRELEAHLTACAECGARLTSMRRVLDGLAQVERATLPPHLAARIRRQRVAEAARRIEVPLRPLRAFFLLPLQPALRTTFAMGLAFVMSLFLVSHGLERDGRENMMPANSMAQHPVVENVEVYFGETPTPLPQTSSEVAGRKFIWTSEKSWVQHGLEGKTPSAHVDARSPQGRMLLTKYSELGLLLEDGSRVVLRYNLETVELRRGRGRVLGFEAPAPVVHERHPEARVVEA